jgi:hypothetical protein
VNSQGVLFSCGFMPGTQGFPDPAVTRFNSSGQRVWTSQLHFATYGSRWKTKLAADNSGRTFIGTVGNTPEALYLCVGAVSADGESLWARTDSSAYHGLAPGAVACDAAGYVYVTGPTYDDSTGFNIVTAKYRSSDGYEEWRQVYDGPRHANDYGYAVAADSSGNVYVAGQAQNSLNRTKPVVLKYSSCGSLQWLRMFGSQNNNDGYFADICVAADGSVYAGGPDPGGNTGTLARYTAAGDSLWEVALQELVCGIALDGAGNLLATGYTRYFDMSTWKFSASGTPVWNRLIDTTSSDVFRGVDVAVDGNANVVATGRWNDGVQDDIITVKYSSAGTAQWIARYHYFGDDVASGIAVDGPGNVYVAATIDDSASTAVWGTLKYRASGPGLAERLPAVRLRETRFACRPAIVKNRCMFALPGDTRWTNLTIINMTGRVMRTWALPASSSGLPALLCWDGTSEGGDRLPDGVYAACLRSHARLATTKFVVGH